MRVVLDESEMSNYACCRVVEDGMLFAWLQRPYHRLTTSLDIASEFTTADVNGVIKQLLSEGIVIEGLIEVGG